MNTLSLERLACDLFFPCRNGGSLFISNSSDWLRYAHDPRNVVCQFSKGVAASLDCRGQIQILVWQDPITLSTPPDIAQAGSPIDSFSTQSTRSHQSSSVEPIGPTTTISRVGDGWEADNSNSRLSQFSLNSLPLSILISIVKPVRENGMLAQR